MILATRGMHGQFGQRGGLEHLITLLTTAGKQAVAAYFFFLKIISGQFLQISAPGNPSPGRVMELLAS